MCVEYYLLFIRLKYLKVSPMKPTLERHNSNKQQKIKGLVDRVGGKAPNCRVILHFHYRKKKPGPRQQTVSGRKPCV